MKTMFRLLAALTALLLLAAAALFYVESSPAARPATGSPTSFNQAFTLTGEDGESLTQQNFLGKPSLYFFGFTHCPDVCPTTLGALTTWLNALGPDARKFNVTFISVDPARDTPATLKQYTSTFHPLIRGATGTPEQLETMARTFMVYYAKIEPKPGEDPANYMMSHSSMILLADRNGTFIGTLDAHDPDAKALAQLRAALK